jgi:two-component system cell cycle sensor histidine kinase PleC
VTIAAMIERGSMPIVRFRDDILRSLIPKSVADLRLVDEQLTLARNATWPNAFLIPLASILVALANASWVPTWRLIVWPMAMSAACILCDLHYRRLLKISDHSPTDIRRRARAYPRMTLLQAVVWCSAGFILWVPGQPDNHAILILFVACTVSGWSSMGAFHLASGIVAMPIYLFSLVAIPLLERSSNNFMLAGLCFAFWVLMRVLLMSNYRTREHMIRLEQERGGLIDNLKAAKDESDAARDRAETASRAKSAFLANMSHELRTPLNAILGFSEIIHTKAMGPAVSDQYSEYAGHIHGSGQHLLSLINDILDLAKIEAGRFDLREADVDLARLLDDLIKMIGDKAQASGIILSVDIDASFPNVRGDERALRQILVNLTSNAIKFTPPAGHVTAFANVLEDGSLAFGVDDTGVGIAPEDHEKVFESFGQGRHDAVLTDQGTGLGLPIVRGLAEAHGGRVILNSVPNEGTRVTVILPKERARERLRAAS